MSGRQEPSVVERGRQISAQRAAEKQERNERRLQENYEHTIRWFRRDFYRDHYVYVRETGIYGSGRYQEDQKNPFPEITEWRLLNEGDDPHRGDSTFVCEGMEFVCRWDYKGGGDRAYWDDGWWPEWSLIVFRPRRFLRFLKKRVEVRVYGPENVAQAMRRS